MMKKWMTHKLTNPFIGCFITIASNSSYDNIVAIDASAIVWSWSSRTLQDYLYSFIPIVKIQDLGC